MSTLKSIRGGDDNLTASELVCVLLISYLACYCYFVHVLGPDWSTQWKQEQENQKKFRRTVLI